MTYFSNLNNLGTGVARLIGVALVGASLFGCAAVKMPPPTASSGNVEKLRGAKLAPANTGAFVLAPGKNPAMDRTLGGLRGSSLTPASGSFSLQLKEEIIAELKGAGLYDENSKTLIEAKLTDSMVDAAIGTGTGRLAAIFTVSRDGKNVFDKEISVEAAWESSFVGAVALPAAINQYGFLYKSLTAKLFDDASFRAVMARPGGVAANAVQLK